MGTGSDTEEKCLGVEYKLSRAPTQRQKEEKVQAKVGEENEPGNPRSQGSYQNEHQAVSGKVKSHTRLLLEKRG